MFVKKLVHFFSYCFEFNLLWSWFWQTQTFIGGKLRSRSKTAGLATGSLLHNSGVRIGLAGSSTVESFVNFDGPISIFTVWHISLLSAMEGIFELCHHGKYEVAGSMVLL